MEDTLKINRRTMSGRIDKVINKYDKVYTVHCEKIKLNIYASLRYVNIAY